MDYVTAAKLDEDLKTVLGLAPGQMVQVDTMTRELVHLRHLNPTAFQAALLLLVSTLLAVGDTLVGVSESDLAGKLERLIALQKDVSAFMKKSNEEAVSQILEQLGVDEVDMELPKEKVN